MPFAQQPVHWIAQSNPESPLIHRQPIHSAREQIAGHLEGYPLQSPKRYPHSDNKNESVTKGGLAGSRVDGS